MHCPYCQYPETKVTDSRLVDEGAQVRRRRECFSCMERFTTFETVALELPRVIKRDGSRSAFDCDKLRAGMLKALEKRPVESEQVEKAITHILRRLRACGERELSSQTIGEYVMEELANLDAVAYVRFASVYRSFQNIDAFQEEIKKLQKKHHDK